MAIVMRGWPWLGLGLALAILAVLLRPRPGLSLGARLRLPTTLAWLGLPLYMLHQVEEHGVDLLGRTYAFQAGLCDTIGHHGPIATCPASEAFILAVNVGAVWIALVGAGVLGRARPSVIAAGLGIAAVNTVAHVAAMARSGAYNPGVLTSIILFVPGCAWILRELLRQGRLRRWQLALVPVSGVAVHAILLGGLALRARGAIDAPTLVVIQVANGLVPLAIGLVAAVAGRPTSARGAAAAR